MFEISILKEMKLSELQEIAKAAKITKTTGVKKETLISQILDFQVSDSIEKSNVSNDNSRETKPKRARMSVEKNSVIQKSESVTLFSDSAENAIEEKKQFAEVPAETSEKLQGSEQKERKVIKFKKADFDAKVASKAASENNSQENASLPTEAEASSFVS